MDIRVRARVLGRRQLAAKGYGELFEKLRENLYIHDPLNLGNGGLAKDEYGSPVVTIIPRLERCSTPEQIAELLEDEFRKHYPLQEMAPMTWSKLASEWWTIWSEFQRQRKHQ